MNFGSRRLCFEVIRQFRQGMAIKLMVAQDKKYRFVGKRVQNPFERRSAGMYVASHYYNIGINWIQRTRCELDVQVAENAKAHGGTLHSRGEPTQVSKGLHHFPGSFTSQFDGLVAGFEVNPASGRFAAFARHPPAKRPRGHRWSGGPADARGLSQHTRDQRVTERPAATDLHGPGARLSTRPAPQIPGSGRRSGARTAARSPRRRGDVAVLCPARGCGCHHQ